MGVTLVPVSVDSHGVAIFILGDCGDHIGALWSGGKSEFGLEESEAVHACCGVILRLDIYEFEAVATRERGYVHRV